MYVNRIKLTRPVFLLIHELVLSKFFSEYEAEWGFGSLEKYQIYGYGEKFNKSKPNLPGFMQINEKVKAYLESNNDKVYEINGQYFYSRYNKLKANPHGPPITLRGIYANIFTLYLGFDSLEDFLKSIQERNTQIDNEKSDDSKLLSDEELLIQNLLIGNVKNKKEKNKYIYTNGLYFYSRLRKRVYIIQLKIDFTPGSAKGVKDKYRSFAVIAKEVLPPEENQPKTYTGVATFKDIILTIDLESTDEKEALHIMLATATDDYSEFKKYELIKGCYLSRSRTNEIISGLTIMRKLRENASIENIPKPIRQYLISDKKQIRVKQKKVTFEVLDHYRNNNGYADILNNLLGNHFIVFVLNKHRDKLIGMGLTINDDYSFTMQLYNESKSQILLYRGAIKLQSPALLVFDSSTFEIYPQNILHFFNMAFLDISNFHKNKSKYWEGRFVWSKRSENDNAIILGELFCIVWQNEPLEEPMSYTKEKLPDQMTMSIFNRLKKDAILRKEPSIWDKDPD